MVNSISEATFDKPLEANEVMELLRKRWGVTYELRVLIKGKSLYIQMMWGFLEKQSMHLSEKEYLENLLEVIDVVNRLGHSSTVRNWLLNIEGKPRIGRALSLPLKGDWRLEEFVL